MKIKSLSYKALWALPALLVPIQAYAFQMNTAHRSDYEGWTPHAHWDAMWNETMMDITIIGVLYFVAAIYFLFRYRRKEHDQVGESPKLTAQGVVGWVMIPVFLFLADDLFLFVKNFDLHEQMREVPANAQTINVTGSMWNWNYDYGNGVDTDNELRVPIGKPVVLRMTSDDVVHSHYMNRYRVTEDLMPGRITYQWFMPDKLGKSVVSCREYCGANHSKMFGHIIVMTQKDYDAWMAQALAEAKAETGHQMAQAAPDQVVSTIN